MLQHYISEFVLYLVAAVAMLTANIPENKACSAHPAEHLLQVLV